VQCWLFPYIPLQLSWYFSHFKNKAEVSFLCHTQVQQLARSATHHSAVTWARGQSTRVYSSTLNLEQHSSQAPGLVLQPCSCMIQYESWGHLNRVFYRWEEKISERFVPGVDQDFSTQHHTLSWISWVLPFPIAFWQGGQWMGRHSSALVRAGGHIHMCP